MKKSVWAYILLLVLLLISSLAVHRARANRLAMIYKVDRTGFYGADKSALPTKTEATVRLPDTARKKTLLVRATWPDTTGTFPVIVFSHGAWGSKDGYQPLVSYWAEHGYVVLQPQHPDSTKEGTRLMDKRAFLYWQARPEQIKLVIDSLPEIERMVPALKGKMDLTRVGVGGHSFGAGTSQLVAGTTARTLNGVKSFADPRPTAFLLLSPQGVGGILSEDSWKNCTRPMMTMSGSKDSSPVDNSSPEKRRDSFTYSPAGDKYLVWVDGLDHGYGGISGTNLWRKNPDHLAWTRTITLAFWDTYLKNSPEAKAYLQSDTLPKSTGNVLTITRK